METLLYKNSTRLILLINILNVNEVHVWGAATGTVIIGKVGNAFQYIRGSSDKVHKITQKAVQDALLIRPETEQVVRDLNVISNVAGNAPSIRRMWTRQLVGKTRRWKKSLRLQRCGTISRRPSRFFISL
ncbi:hypothetical protein GK047_15720 [Paenibacillus sp. SYP-B3998]|uniref:Uncharacterized protein n=1 Tax=Paenibacillus sp. SYP-B3998 TaxID=2678564 RepID=A0A6G3ZZ15_9BACL|nr:hypothetical protein [Paenibacillus sp. SYP-B3998]NEW07453.1 hypothetical protein [Paenibacillus sp. SYP-B3998]